MKWLKLTLLEVCLWILVCHVNSSNSSFCSLAVSTNTMQDSWQSSSLRATGDRSGCFVDSTEDRRNSFLYFHTKSASNAVGGFHWLAIKLKEALFVRSVTIRNRETAKDSAGRQAGLNSRAANIEVYTSQSDSIYLGGEHCNTDKVAKEFTENGNVWQLCGSTKANVSSGEYLTVDCDPKRVHMILLRKAVDASTEQYMSFIDMWLNMVGIANPPSRLLINPVRDGHCGNGTFTFQSSTALPEPPRHECSGRDELGQPVQVELAASRAKCNQNFDALMSEWHCVNCSTLTGFVTLNCTASLPDSSAFVSKQWACPPAVPGAVALKSAILIGLSACLAVILIVVAIIIAIVLWKILSKRTSAPEAYESETGNQTASYLKTPSASQGNAHSANRYDTSATMDASGSASECYYSKVNKNRQAGAKQSTLPAKADPSNRIVSEIYLEMLAVRP